MNRAGRQAAEIVQNIITKDHGGTLTVRSEPGKGSCFIIRIPTRKKQ
jgi:signal transduction histidine kinase